MRRIWAPTIAVTLLAVTGAAQAFERPFQPLEHWPDGEDGILRGSGLKTEVVGTVEALLEQSSLVIDSSQTFLTVETYIATSWLGGLHDYSDLEPGMVVRALVSWRANNTLRAVSIERLGTGYGTQDLRGEVAYASNGVVRLLGGERIIINQITRLDGDAATFADIELGFTLAARCVLESGGAYLALWAHVEGMPGSGFGPRDPGAHTEVLVVLAEGAEATTVAQRYGAEVLGTLPGLLVHLFRWDNPLEAADFASLLADEDIVDAEPNFSASDPESIRRRLWAHDAEPASSKYLLQPAVRLADITRAQVRSAGAGTMVAVLDTGIDRFHYLFNGRLQLADGIVDFVDNDKYPWETRDGIDQDVDLEFDEAAGHGTFVAGLILLVAPETTIVPFRVLNDDGHGTSFGICQAIIKATDMGVDVINMSFAHNEDDRPRILDYVLQEAADRGIMLVAGAGNDTKGELPFPASDSRVFAVAAATEVGDLADFSNNGPGVALMAPGEDLYSAGLNGAMGYWSGTSMAAPLVSGAAALLREINSRLGPEDMTAALLQAADPPPAGGDIPDLLQVGGALALVPFEQPRQPAPRTAGRRH